MNHFEQLIAEWLEFIGYFVRRNVNVGRRLNGGHEGELDVVGFHPETKHVLHIEPSIDASTWESREQRFHKKFSVGKKYILSEVFPWLPDSTPVEQWAVVWGGKPTRATLGGGKVVSTSQLYQLISRDVRLVKLTRVIPEKFALLRTMQFTMRWAMIEGDVKPDTAE